MLAPSKNITRDRKCVLYRKRTLRFRRYCCDEHMIHNLHTHTLIHLAGRTSERPGTSARSAPHIPQRTQQHTHTAVRLLLLPFLWAHEVLHFLHPRTVFWLGQSFRGTKIYVCCTVIVALRCAAGTTRTACELEYSCASPIPGVLLTEMFWRKNK